MADGATLRRQVLDAVERERAGWNRLVAAVGDRREQPGVQGAWSFVQIAAHLNDWRTRALEVLEAEARGDEPPPPPWPPDATSDDTINAWFQERSRGQSADAVLARTAELGDRLASIVAGVPIDRLDDPAAFPSLGGRSLAGAILGGDFFGHRHEEHEPDIRRWLAAGTRSGVAGARGGML